jgi:glutathione S-transferase
MIALNRFGPYMGLPDGSPFCVKADVLLKMSGLAYQTEIGSLGKAPKGKLPFIVEKGRKIADSSLIRMYLEDQHGIDFDKGLNAEQKAQAWAFEKLCEDNLYWGTVHFRWMNDANFDRGPRTFFNEAPAVLRPLIIPAVRRKVRRDLRGQGLGRHTPAEIDRLMIRGYDAIAAQLGSKSFLMGDTPCGADATIFAWILSITCPLFDTPIRTAAERHANLVAYRDRGMVRWYPDFNARAG